MSWKAPSASLGNNIADTYSDCSTTAVGTGNQAALCGCHWDLELLPIKVQRSSHTHRYRHVANHIFTAGAHYLENKNVEELVKQEAEWNREDSTFVCVCVCVCVCVSSPWSSHSWCMAVRRVQKESEVWQISSVFEWPLLSLVSPSSSPVCMQGCVWSWPVASPQHHSVNEAPAIRDTIMPQSGQRHGLHKNKQINSYIVAIISWGYKVGLYEVLIIPHTTTLQIHLCPLTHYYRDSTIDSNTVFFFFYSNLKKW